MRDAPSAPVRTCVACRTRRRRDDLLRFVHGPHGVRADRGAGLPGRGAYLCPDDPCIAAAGRRDAGVMRRALRGGSVAETRAALEAARTMVVDHRVPTGP